MAAYDQYKIKNDYEKRRTGYQMQAVKLQYQSYHETALNCFKAVFKESARNTQEYNFAVQDVVTLAQGRTDTSLVHFSCRVCYGLVHEPMQCNQCQHDLFCNLCLTNTGRKKCTTCHLGEYVPANKLVRKILGKQEIKCTREHCSKAGAFQSYDEFLVHVDECLQPKMTCPLQCADKTVFTSSQQVIDHFNLCQNQLAPCNDCGKIFPKDKSQHDCKLLMTQKLISQNQMKAQEIKMMVASKNQILEGIAQEEVDLEENKQTLEYLRLMVQTLSGIDWELQKKFLHNDMYNQQDEDEDYYQYDEQLDNQLDVQDGLLSANSDDMVITGKNFLQGQNQIVEDQFLTPAAAGKLEDDYIDDQDEYSALGGQQGIDDENKMIMMMKDF